MIIIVLKVAKVNINSYHDENLINNCVTLCKEQIECRLLQKKIDEDPSLASKVIYDMLGDKDYPLEGEVEINGTTYSFLENAIALIIFDLYKHPDNYGYSYDDIKSTEGYQLDYH